MMIKVAKKRLIEYIMNENLSEFPNHKKICINGDKGIHFILVHKKFLNELEDKEINIAEFFYNKILEKQNLLYKHDIDIPNINEEELLSIVSINFLLKLIFRYKKELPYPVKKKINKKVVSEKVFSAHNKQRISLLIMEALKYNELEPILFKNMFTWGLAHYMIIKDYESLLSDDNSNLIDNEKENECFDKEIKALYHLYLTDITEQTVIYLLKSTPKQDVLEYFLGLNNLKINNEDLVKLLRKHLKAVIEKNCEDPFRFISIPSSKIYHSVCTALYRKDMIIDNNRMKLQLNVDDKYQGYISDLTIDVLDCISNFWLKQKIDNNSYIIIDVDSILMMRGLKQNINGKGRQGGYKEKQRREIRDQIKLLENIKVEAVMETKDNKHQYNGRIIEIQQNSIGSLGLYSYQIRLGEILISFLKERFFETQLLSSKVLNYNIKSYWLEKRIARYIYWLWRINATKNLKLDIKIAIRSILKDVNFDLSYGTSKKEERIIKAFDNLVEDDVINDYKETSNNNDDSEAIPGQYLQEIIKVSPPKEVLDRYMKIKKFKIKKSPKN